MAKLFPNVRTPAKVKHEYLTTDPDRLAYLKANPRRVECTAPQMGAMFERGEKLIDKDYVAQFVDRPVAVFHGTSDFVNSFKATAQFFDLLQVKDKTFYSFPELYHDVFHETPERVEAVMNDFKAWLLEHTQKNSHVANSVTRSTVAEADEVSAEGPGALKGEEVSV